MRSYKMKYINKTIKKIFTIGLMACLNTFIFSQAAVVEHQEKSEFEKKHLKESDREAVKIDKVLTNKSMSVLKNNWERRIELIGIDLPELNEIMELYDQAGLPQDEKEEYKMLYYEARSAIKEFVSSGDVLFIEQDVREKNTYGNLLVYLLAPNRRIINIELIKLGYAYPVKDIDNKTYEEEMFAALEYAIDHKNGLYQVFKLKSGGTVDLRGGVESEDKIKLRKKE